MKLLSRFQANDRSLREVTHDEAISALRSSPSVLRLIVESAQLEFNDVRFIYVLSFWTVRYFEGVASTSMRMNPSNISLILRLIQVSEKTVYSSIAVVQFELWAKFIMYYLFYYFSVYRWFDGTVGQQWTSFWERLHRNMRGW